MYRPRVAKEATRDPDRRRDGAGSYCATGQCTFIRAVAYLADQPKFRNVSRSGEPSEGHQAMDVARQLSSMGAFAGQEYGRGRVAVAPNRSGRRETPVEAECTDGEAVSGGARMGHETHSGGLSGEESGWRGKQYMVRRGQSKCFSTAPPGRARQSRGMTHAAEGRSEGVKVQKDAERRQREREDAAGGGFSAGHLGVGGKSM